MPEHPAHPPAAPWASFAPDVFLGKVALVTGGGTGIGRQIALGFARLGAAVCVASRKIENLRGVEGEIRALGRRALAVPCDVRDAAAVDAMVARCARELGRLDFLINNAGANFAAPAMAITPNGWRAVTATVLDGTFYCSQAAARVMIEQGGGRIVSISATNAWNGSPMIAHSGASKAGVLSLTETLAAEWGPFGIAVNAVAPGAVDTEGAGSRLWADPEQRRKVEEQAPLGGRMARPEDVVGAVLFLCTEAASFITGAVIAIDGGARLSRWNFL